MGKGFRLIVGSAALCALIALSSCGTSGVSNSGTSTGSSLSSVTISTDRTVYQSSDEIQVSVTNNLKTGIFAYDTRASCTILDLQAQVNGTWQNSKVSRCALGRMARLVEIAAGKTYQARISAGVPGVKSPGFPAGTYRLALSYTISSQRPAQNMATIYSAPITVK